jgi:nicotinamidase-related amidase
MPVTTLDPKTALIVIDLQKGIVGLPTAHPTNQVMTDTNADAHHNSITRIFPRLGETGTTREIIELLNNR